MTKQEAVAFAKTEWWKGLGAREQVAFQLFEDRLCMPFDAFHKAIEEALGRPVYTHEFGLNRQGLQDEFRGLRAPATLTEILELIPEEKRVVVVTE
jgi:hypothetical protein